MSVDISAFGEEGPEDAWRRVGERLRAIRESRGLSVREVGRRVGCSASHISQIELGRAAPSVNVLYAVTNQLGISMDSLFDNIRPASLPAGEPGEGDRGSGADVPDVDSDPRAEARHVQRRATRRAIDLNAGVRWERLTPQSEDDAEFLEVTYAVGGGSADMDRAIRHDGREYGIILEGVLAVAVGFDRYTLYPGDSVAFDSTVPHRFWNAGDTPVKAIWFVRDRESVGERAPSRPTTSASFADNERVLGQQKAQHRTP